MRKRILNPKPEERKNFGLIGWLEKTRVALPLKGVECAFDVCGDLVSVELDQIFEQNNRQAVDCLYSFPLPAGAAVYRCEMHVNGRIIRARVEERDRAQELAREMKAAGYRTALVEMERDNLFTLSLGNVQPGDVVVIRFAYFQLLTRLGEWTSFSIPFCPGIRYIPGTPLLRASKSRGTVDDTDQVPDASRISPPRIDRLHRDAAYLSVEGTVEHPLGDVKDISSPSHPVLVRDGAEISKIALAENRALPDSDFVLRWTETLAEKVKPMGWMLREQQETFALLRLRAPTHVAPQEEYSQDIYFLIDRSGSMQGLKWEKAVEAFREFLGVLGKNDRVWATFFESQFRDLAEKPLSVAEVLSDHAIAGLEKLGAAGGTELLPALEHVVAKVAEHSGQRPTSLLLITDGQVGNEAQILQRLAKNPQLSVHVFGIDVAINDGFLRKLAAQNHGSSCLLSPQDDIAGAVRRLGDRLRRPVLTGIKVCGEWELPAAQLPDLHAGEVLSLPLKGEHGSSPVTVTVEAAASSGVRDAFRFDLVETETAALKLLWAKQRIDFLLAQGKTDDAISLAKETNLVCEGAAFIAWDEEEKVAVSEREIYQPAMLPRMSRGVHGFAAIRKLGARAQSDGYFFGAAGRMDDLSQMGELSAGLREFSTPEPVLETVLTHLRDEMRKDLLFHSAAGIQFLDKLLAWARGADNINATPPGAPPMPAPQTAKRVALLTQLQTALRRAVTQPRAERIELIRQWVDQSLEGEVKRSALRNLKELQSEVQVRAEAGLPSQAT